MKYFAHRGLKAEFPENTMVAFFEACTQGFDGIETDVHMTKDGELVLIHDESIDRTSNGAGEIKDLVYEELKQYNFADGDYGFEVLPTLRQLLEFLKDKKMYLNIEIKTDRVHYENIEQKVYDLVQECKMQDYVLYSSFYLPSLIKLREIDPTVYLGYIAEDHDDLNEQIVIDYALNGYHPKNTLMTKDKIKFLKEKGITIAIWGKLTKEDCQEYEKLGVDIVITDNDLKHQ